MKAGILHRILLVISIIFAGACKNQQREKMPKINPPKAKKIAKELVIHEDVRIDNYYWLNNREDEEVLSYLNKENKYYTVQTAHTKGFQSELFTEMKGRIKEDDSSVPYKLNGYWYQTLYQTGKEYPIYTRHKEKLNTPKDIMFDGNEMALGSDYFQIGGIAISPNNKIAAYGVDKVSRRQYNIRFKNLETGEVFEDSIENTTGGGVWANDNQTFFYTKNDTVTLRSDKIYKHKLGTPSSEDELVFHEKDDTFTTYVYRTKSRKYIVIGSSSTLTSEYQILPCDEPDGSFKLFSERERGLEYSISHYKDGFYILTNKDRATNFKLMKTPEMATTSGNWKDFVAHRKEVLLEYMDIFKDYYVLSERENGLSQIRIVKWDGSLEYYLPFKSETYTAYTSTNPDFDTEILRYGYNSLSTPSSVIDFNMRTKEKEVKKEQEVLGGSFLKENYREERIWATARDGVKIPISLIYHKNTVLNSGTPILQYAYGSYGISMTPSFSSARLSLVDRGMIYAIAHIRGGAELGEKWRQDGRMFKKLNTFYDFIDSAKWLQENKYTSPDRMVIQGGSAGGLLMGGVVNMSPETFKAAIVQVPFVDVMNTMLDETLPLTTEEWIEWGNPNEKEAYDYMVKYSPYDNVSKQAYPNMLVEVSLWDSQVPYWEGAKFTAKVREMMTNDAQVLLKTNMGGGHGGSSGRYDRYKEIAFNYAYALSQSGISE